MAISVEYSIRYVVSRRVAFLVLIWRPGSVGVEIDRRVANKQLKALTQYLNWIESKVFRDRVSPIIVKVGIRKE